jgi:hypothetical protein
MTIELIGVDKITFLEQIKQSFEYDIEHKNKTNKQKKMARERVEMTLKEIEKSIKRVE